MELSFRVFVGPKFGYQWVFKWLPWPFPTGKWPERAKVTNKNPLVTKPLKQPLPYLAAFIVCRAADTETQPQTKTVQGTLGTTDSQFNTIKLETLLDLAHPVICTHSLFGRPELVYSWGWGKPFQKVGREAPHLLEGLSRPPGPPRPPKINEFPAAQTPCIKQIPAITPPF